jgi:DNA invertase Pin-like site-specific DNA recombinase
VRHRHNEDGCYDPAEFNDGLVLGMKGTFAQAELHIIRARLHGGKINKAHKGELHFALPVGFIFDDDKNSGGSSGPATTSTWRNGAMKRSTPPTV